LYLIGAIWSSVTHLLFLIGQRFKNLKKETKENQENDKKEEGNPVEPATPSTAAAQLAPQRAL